MILSRCKELENLFNLTSFKEGYRDPASHFCSGEMNPVDWKVKCTKKTLQPPQRRKDAHAVFSILNDLDELRSK